MDDDSSRRSTGAPEGAPPDAQTHAGSHPRLRASDILEDFAARAEGDVVTVGDLLGRLEDRAFGMLFLALALPNVIPLPGLSTATGAPMVLLGVQLALGYAAPRLPRRAAAISFSRTTLLSVIGKARPWLARIENRLRPRSPWFVQAPGERLAGVFVAVLAAVLSLPIVFGNLPPAAAIALIALGLVEKDGLTVVVGMVVGVLALCFVGLVVFGLGEAALYLAAQAFPFLFIQAPASCSPTC